jgi:hypothetical protein
MDFGAMIEPRGANFTYSSKEAGSVPGHGTTLQLLFFIGRDNRTMRICLPEPIGEELIR